MKFIPVPHLNIKFLHLENPTDPDNYVDRGFATGTPLNWQDDLTGTLPAAMSAFLNRRPTDDDLRLVIAYLRYHIHAPCWLEAHPFGVSSPEMATKIEALRARSLELKTVQDIHEFSTGALDIGIDPL